MPCGISIGLNLRDRFYNEGRTGFNYLMCIRINLDIIMAKTKISLAELAERVGITQANLSILKTEKAKAIRFSTLEKICKELNCQPGDILEYEPDEENENN